MHYEKNHIQINQNSFYFDYNIRTVISYKKTYIILLDIPFNLTQINNLFCIDSNANLVWQVEDLNKRYPEQNHLPYEQIGIEGDAVYASDFLGRCYKINIHNGKIESCTIVK